MKPLFSIALLALAACPLTPQRRTCADVEADFAAESAAIRACDTREECGQVLTGTSCGCTRDLVARLDADTSRFYALIDEAGVEGCDLPLESTCDCPEADGFACGADGTCGWNYVTEPPEPFSACRAADGDAYTLVGVTLADAVLTAEVTYSGGCATHTFVPCWPDQSFMESAPVQARLELWHDDPDDPCDAIIRELVDVDLTPLADAWRAAYGPHPGEILVHLGDHTVDYTFD